MEVGRGVPLIGKCIIGVIQVFKIVLDREEKDAPCKSSCGRGTRRILVGADLTGLGLPHRPNDVNSRLLACFRPSLAVSAHPIKSD